MKPKTDDEILEEIYLYLRDKCNWDKNFLNGFLRNKVNWDESEIELRNAFLKAITLAKEAKAEEIFDETPCPYRTGDSVLKCNCQSCKELKQKHTK